MRWGVARSRGMATPVVDLNRLLGEASAGAGGRFVSLRVDERRVILAEDEAREIRSLDDRSVEALPPLLAGREVLTSHFVHGIYFGGPSRLEWGLVSSPGVMAPSVREQVRDLHRRLRERLEQAGLLFGALAGAPLP